MRVLKVLPPLLLLSATLAAQGRVATTTTLTSGPNPALTGQTVTLRVSVTSRSGRTPTGTVSFGPLGSATLVNGVASLPTSSLAVGTHRIVARYPGAPGFRPSVSDVLQQVVLPTATTKTVVTTSGTPAPAGQAVTFTATVTSPGFTPAGTARFIIDGAPAASAVAVVGGKATFTTSALAVGRHSVSARFSDGASFAPSTSAPITQVVDPANPLSVTPAVVDFGQVVVGMTSAPSTLTLRNAGSVTTGPLTITNSTGDGGDFAALAGASTCTTVAVGGLPAGASCTFVFTFIPTTTGPRTRSLTLAGTPGGSASFTLNGTGIPVPQAVLALTPASADFGSVEVGQRSPVTRFTIANTGTAPSGPLTLGGLQGANPGEFIGDAASTTCTSSGLGVGAGCTIGLVFAPQAAGPRSATLVAGASPGGTVGATLTGTGMVTQALTASPTTFDYGSVDVGTTTPPHRFTITNTGGLATGSLVSRGFEGANPGAFAGVTPSSTCGAIAAVGLAAGASCDLDVTFTPQAAGSHTASLTFSATPGGTVTIQLAGAGNTPPHLTLTPAAHDFGSAGVGIPSAPQIFTFTNDGGTATGPFGAAGQFAGLVGGANPGDFGGLSTTCDPGGLAAHTSCTVVLVFVPTALGPRTAVLGLSAAGDTAIAALSGTGVEAHLISVTPPAHDYGPVGVGISSPVQRFVLTNTGTIATGPFAPVQGSLGGSIGGLVGDNPGDFLVDNNSSCAQAVAGLAPGASCNIDVAFHPQALGSRSAFIAFSTTPGGLVRIDLSGTGIVGQLLTVSPASFDYGAVDVGTTSPPHRFTLTNTGTTATGPFVSRGFEGANPGAFAGVAPSSTCDDIGAVGLAAGASCDLVITFTPPGDGAYSASLTLGATSSGAVTIQLAGTGVFRLAAITISPASYDFGPVLVGQEAEKFFTVTNASTAPVQILGQGFFSPGPGFALDVFSTCQSIVMLDAGATCAIGVRFIPRSAGPFSQTLHVVATGDLTATAAVSGTGTLPVLSITPTAHDFGALTVGQTGVPVIFRIDLNFFGSISAGSVGVTGPAATAYVVQGGEACSADLTVSGSGFCQLVISFAPAATGPQPATLIAQIRSVDGTTYTATSDLTGTGVAPIVLSVAPSSQDFGSVIVGGTSPNTTFTVTNPSTSKLTLDPIIVAGTNPADFVVGPGKLSCANNLEPGASCDFDVAFSPRDVGARVASVTISAGPTTRGTTVALSGSGAPALTIAPAGQDFGSILLGQSSAAIGFTVTNVSSVSVLINNFVVAGHFNDFTVAPGSCGPALPSGGSCTFTVTFTPTVLGARAATVTAVGTGGTPTVSASLTGTGTDQPTIALRIAPDTFLFASIPVGASSPPATFTVTNLLAVRTGTINTFGLTGVNTTDYLISQGTCAGATLDPGGSCTFSVTFAPQNAGGHRSTLTVRTSAGETGTTQLRGFAIVPAVLSITPASHDFGFVFFGQGAPVTFTVTNAAGNVGAVLDFTFAGPNSSDFIPIVDGYTCAYVGQLLLPAASCTIGIIFQPSVLGPRSATFTVTDIGGLGTSHATATLTGGITPGGVLTISPASKNFGTVPVGFFTPPTEFVVTNVGTTIALLSGVDVVNPADINFVLEAGSTCGAFLEVGARCSMFVGFIPIRTGPLQATLLVSYDAGTVSAALTGTGAASSTAVRAAAASGTIELTPFSAADATRDLLGVPTLSPARRSYLDLLGNHDGSYDLGDLLAFLDRHHLAVSPALLRAAEHHKERVP
jgi:hypothetical protein